jgi:hypothetical protein
MQKLNSSSNINNYLFFENHDANYFNYLTFLKKMQKLMPPDEQSILNKDGSHYIFFIYFLFSIQKNNYFFNNPTQMNISSSTLHIPPTTKCQNKKIKKNVSVHPQSVSCRLQ